ISYCHSRITKKCISNKSEAIEQQMNLFRQQMLEAQSSELASRITHLSDTLPTLTEDNRPPAGITSEGMNLPVESLAVGGGFIVLDRVSDRLSRVARTNQVSPIRDLSRLSRNDREEKKIRRARADLRNCSARDDEIVLVRTRRDSRQALTAMTYDLESLTLLTTPSLEQPMLYLGIRSETIEVKTTMHFSSQKTFPAFSMPSDKSPMINRNRKSTSDLLSRGEFDSIDPRINSSSDRSPRSRCISRVRVQNVNRRYPQRDTRRETSDSSSEQETRVKGDRPAALARLHFG
ncbi:hypothetical protein DBV15_11558, partial [Temnothorax longispinosus]